MDEWVDETKTDTKGECEWQNLALQKEKDTHWILNATLLDRTGKKKKGHIL